MLYHTVASPYIIPWHLHIILYHTVASPCYTVASPYNVILWHLHIMLYCGIPI